MTGVERAAWGTAQRIKSFSVTQLSAESGIAVDTARRYLRRWERAGLVSREGAGKSLRFLAVSQAPEMPPAREQSVERNLWNAMRHCGAFSARDLALQATTDEIGISEDMAARYIRSLLPAGYLRVMQRAIPGRRPAVYRLIRNTGPLPPRECRVAAVWDENRATWSHFPEAPR